MGDKGGRSSCRCKEGKDDDNLFHEFSLLLKTIEDSRPSGHGVSVNLVMRSVVFIDEFNWQTMELRHGWDSQRIIQEDKFLSSLTQDFLELSFEADNFFQALVTNLKNLKDELRDLLEALLQWNPSLGWEHEGEIIVLDKLWRFGWGESFSKELLKLFQGLLKQHQDILEKVQQQGASLKRKFRKLRWLKKAVSTIFAGFILAASVCSVIAAALQPGAGLAIIAAVLTSGASWPHLALWVDKLWMDKLKELQQGKELCTMLSRVEVNNRGHVLRDFEPMYSFVSQLQEMLENVHSNDELLQMKESLQNELWQVIDSVSESIKNVESTKDNIEGRRNKYLNSIWDGMHGDSSSARHITSSHYDCL